MSRYETSARGHGIDEGLAARVHDPLWFLARQWQLGELRHENTGSPAWVEVTTEAHLVDEWHPPTTGGWRPVARDVPLERLVEEHGGGPTARLRLAGGVRVRRLLAARATPQDLAALVATCPFPAPVDAVGAVEDAVPADEVPVVDAADARVRAAVPDGAALAALFGRLGDSGSRGPALAALRASGATLAEEALDALVHEWLSWWRAHVPPVVPEDEDCWDEHRLEHAFALRSSTLRSVELHAQEYPGGRLDWSAVDALEVPGHAAGPALVVEQRAVPAPARFGGMPAPRFWEMEDARFDPGAVDAGPIDLGRLMLVAFATVYGNDWFVLPVRTPVGSLSRITRFEVHDVFGERTTLTAVGADQDGWGVFALTAAGTALVPGQERPTSPWFFLAPALPDWLESPPTDVALLLRDEMANVAWAVEVLVADDHGRPRDRRSTVPPAADASAAGGHPRYRVVGDVPGSWFPLVPEQLADEESVRLRMVPVSRIVVGRLVESAPAGSLVPPLGGWLHEEEVPRAGVQLERTWQHARWHDGSRHVWQARRKVTSRGEGSSGLVFDRVV